MRTVNDKIVALAKAALELIPSEKLRREVVGVIGSAAAVADLALVIAPGLPGWARIGAGAVVTVAAGIGARGNVKQLID